MPRREQSPEEVFPIGRAENAPSDDIGWHFATIVQGRGRNTIQCKICQTIITGGITRLKEHLAHMTGEVKACARVSTFVRENMMKLLLDSKAKKNDQRKRKEEFVSRLRGDGNDDDEDMMEDDGMRQATRESMTSHRQWQDRKRFPGSGIGSSSGGASSQYQRHDLQQRMRNVDVDLERSKSMKQTKVKTGFMKNARKVLGKALSRLIIYERLPMNLSTSPWLHALLAEAAKLGPGVKCPTPYEISEVYLNEEYAEMQKYIQKLKPVWKERGVTIMCDGWTNGINHMHIMNFLVYSSNGTVFLKSIDASDVASRNTDYYFNLLDKIVEEVGEEYVVQVVTDNEASLKAAGLKLMEKRPRLYWSPCAAHCLDLCLEDIGKKENVKKVLEEAKKVTLFIYNHIWTVSLMKKHTDDRELIRPAITRFATHFLQLESIVNEKQALKAMFDSDEYKNSKYGKEKEGGAAYEARKVVMDKFFWNKASDILKVFEPIVKVLKLVDGDDKPTMGFLYEAIDRAKQAIEKNCRYSTYYNEMIDRRWNYMHSDLHSAGYFLNPQFQFGLVHGSHVAKETLEGTRKVISKLEPNVDIQIKAINQLLLFRDKIETFGTIQAQKAWSQMKPAEWWLIYGSCAPELQRIAIKVLSQTTSASNCERNWSTFSYIHTKTRNRLKYQKLQKLVFTFYNMKLKMRTTMRRSREDIEKSFNPINLDHIFQEDYLSPWIEESEGPLLDGIQNAEWLPIDSDDEIEEIPGGDVSNSSQTPSQSGDGGLSPPSDGNSGGSHGNDGNGSPEQSHGLRERSIYSFQEESYVRRDQNLLPQRVEEDSHADVTVGGSSRGRRRRGKNRRREDTPLDDSSSSSGVQSFGDFGFVAPFEGSQGNYPSYYQQPSYMSHGYYPYMPNPNAPFYSQPHVSYNDSSTNSSYDYQQIEPPRSSGFFDYVFGGSGNNNDEGDSGSYDPARRSTMW